MNISDDTCKDGKFNGRYWKTDSRVVQYFLSTWPLAKHWTEMLLNNHDCFPTGCGYKAHSFHVQYCKLNTPSMGCSLSDISVEQSCFSCRLIISINTENKTASRASSQPKNGSPECIFSQVSPVIRHTSDPHSSSISMNGSSDPQYCLHPTGRFQNSFPYPITSNFPLD